MSVTIYQSTPSKNLLNSSFSYICLGAPLQTPKALTSGYLALELFGNLIITFLGIFTPLITILMNISKDGILALEKTHKATKAIMDQEVRASAGAATVDHKQMKSYINRIEKTIKDHNKSLKLLRPRRQFFRTFCTLMVSFILLEVFISIPQTIYVSTLSISSNWALCGSIFAFGFALYIVWQVLTTLIKVRELIEKPYDDFTLSPQPN